MEPRPQPGAQDVTPGPARECDPAGSGPGPAWPTRIFALLAALAFIFAFVGLSVGGFWTDELFTMYVVDHEGGFREVLRRALTDTHPPAYYLALHAWTRVFGTSEPAARSFSAICCIGALATFALRTGRALTPTARAFAAAAAGASVFWFFQSQNARDYGLALLAVSAMVVLALEARVSSGVGRAPSPLVHLGLFAAGLLASLTHFYGLLAAGAVYAALVLTIPRLRERLGFVAGGLVVLGVDLVYIRGLVAHTRQDFHQLWFSNDPGFLLNQLAHVCTSTAGPGVSIGAAALAVLAWRRRSGRAAGVSPEARWLTGLGALGLFGMVLGGLAVSVLFAPSFSDANVLVGSPFLWILLARLYDIGAPRPGAAGSVLVPAGLAVLIAVQLALMLPSRFLPRTEQWRASAQAVAALPACAGQEVPAVMPARFAAPTPFFLELFRRSFYGRYLPGGSDRIQVYPEAAFTGQARGAGLQALLARRTHDPAACPLLAWAAHDMTAAGARALAGAIARRTGVDPDGVEVHPFYDYKVVWLGEVRRPSAFLILARQGRG